MDSSNDKTINYELNLSKIQVLNSRFSQTKSSAGNDKVVCQLCVKANFKEFEKQFLLFNETFIRKHVINYLPVVHKIFAFAHEETAEGGQPLPETMATAYIDGERGYYKLVAKYYLEPNKKARVMYFDNKYYADFVKDSGLGNIDEDQMVDVKLLPCANKRLIEDNYEKETWEYCDCFTVMGSVCCHPDDQFDIGKGRKIAMLRAMRKAANRVKNLVIELYDLVNNEDNDMLDIINRPKQVLSNFDLYSEKCNTNGYSDVMEENDRITAVFKWGGFKKFLKR